MSDIFVKAAVLQGVRGSVQCGQQILGHERHLVLKGLLKLCSWQVFAPPGLSA